MLKIFTSSNYCTKRNPIKARHCCCKLLLIAIEREKKRGKKRKREKERKKEGGERKRSGLFKIDRISGDRETDAIVAATRRYEGSKQVERGCTCNHLTRLFMRRYFEALLYGRGRIMFNDTFIMCLSTTTKIFKQTYIHYTKIDVRFFR